MIIQAGTKVINKGTTTSIADIICGQYIIHVFQGSLSQYDILLKYKGPFSNRIRTPKHVHWVVDLLLKKEHDPVNANIFLNNIQAIWQNSGVLTNNNLSALTTFLTNLNTTYNFQSSIALDPYGEYPTEFLYALLSLLVVQEKTNATANGTQAVMFGQILQGLAANNLDIFKILSTAGFNGK